MANTLETMTYATLLHSVHTCTCEQVQVVGTCTSVYVGVYLSDDIL